MRHLVLLFLLISFLGAQTTEVEITSEPSHHLAIENEYVRVFRVEAPPHAATLPHRHRHDYIFVMIGAANISNEVEGKPPVELKFADGEARFTEGNFAHVARNLSDNPFRNVTIELLQDEKLRQARSRWPMEAGDRAFPGGHIKVLFIKDAVRVSETDLEPGATIPSHHHDQPHLVVAVSDLDLRSDVEGRGPASVTLKAGEARWVTGGFTHSVTNTSSHPARLVTLEFQAPEP